MPYGFIHGEPVVGEHVNTTAQQRCFDKIGLVLDFSAVGSALITQSVAKRFVTYSHAVILTATTDKDIAIQHDATGRNFWSKKLDDERTFPSCNAIVQAIEQGDWWLELNYSFDA